MKFLGLNENLHSQAIRCKLHAMTGYHTDCFLVLLQKPGYVRGPPFDIRDGGGLEFAAWTNYFFHHFSVPPYFFTECLG